MTIQATIRDATPDDASAICAIYNPFIAESVITFEEEQLTPEEMGDRIARIQERYPWIVLEEEGRILGYAYGASWRHRHAYRFCAESSVYVDPSVQGKGIGRALYGALIKRLKQDGFREIIGVITLPNEVSENLHRSFGFHEIGVFPKVGFKFDRWLDVAFWQLSVGPAPEGDAGA